MEALFPLIITFGLMWVLLIRPQQRRVRQHQQVVASLVEGDEVVTTGGLIGTVEEINDDVLTVEVAPGVQIKLLRSAVQTRIGGPDDPVLDDVDPDEFVIDEFVPDDVVEEPDLPAIETTAVEELPPASSGELPPTGSGTVPVTPATPATPVTPADPVVGDVPPRRSDAGNGGS